MAHSDRSSRRVLLGAACLMSPSVAAALAPIADHKAMQYFRDHGLIRHMAGKPVVIWGEVLESIKRGGLAG